MKKLEHLFDKRYQKEIKSQPIQNLLKVFVIRIAKKALLE